MRQHGGRDAERRGALRPTVAAAMVRLAGKARGVLLDAEGPVFSAGHDFADMTGRDLAGMRAWLARCAELMQRIQRIPQPVLASASIGGLIVMPDPITLVNRERIVALANERRLPAAYPYRYFATVGGLVSYGPSSADSWRRAAVYVDRILKGAKPADLPIQNPTKFEIVLNLKTAKALGIEPPLSLLMRIDEVIE
jgi:hypothetical protein